MSRLQKVWYWTLSFCSEVGRNVPSQNAVFSCTAHLSWKDTFFFTENNFLPVVEIVIAALIVYLTALQLCQCHAFDAAVVSLFKRCITREAELHLSNCYTFLPGVLKSLLFRFIYSVVIEHLVTVCIALQTNHFWSNEHWHVIFWFSCYAAHFNWQIFR